MSNASCTMSPPARRPAGRRPSHAVSRSYAAVVVSPAAPWHCSARSSPTPCARAFGSTIQCMASSSSPKAGDSDGWPMMSTDMLGMALSKARQEKVWQPAIAATWLMILTGWRRGEVLGLRWSEVDLPRRTARLADTKTGASLRPLSEAACAVIQSQPRIGDVVFASRSGETPIVGYRKMWLRIAKLGDLPADITPHVLRHSFASLAADLGYNEPTIASLLGHKTHSITSRYMHSADAVLLAAADAVANATMKLMDLGSGATPVAGSAPRWISRVGRIHLSIGVFVPQGCGGLVTHGDDDVAGHVAVEGAGMGEEAHRRRALLLAEEPCCHWLTLGEWHPYGSRSRSGKLDGLSDWLRERFRLHAGNTNAVRQELAREEVASPSVCDSRTRGSTVGGVSSFWWSVRGRSPSNGCDPCFRKTSRLDVLRGEIGDVSEVENLLRRWS